MSPEGQQNEPPFKHKAVILDMDGLMLDTGRPIIVAWEHAARKMG
jgi:beta-phosphoglucomutase-like phosphatase (HAD superfamily)